MTDSPAPVTGAPRPQHDIDAPLRALISRAQGFLSDAEAIAFSPCHPTPVLLRARFHIERFDPALFDALECPCPASLHTAALKRRAEFLAGRAMAKAALEACALPSPEIPIGLDRAPIWPTGATGSISHARGHCAAVAMPAARPNVALGVDIEAFANPRAATAIRKIALTPVDHAALKAHSAPPDAEDRLATLIFSAKETLFKTLYPTVRAHFGFDAAAVAQLAPAGDAAQTGTLTLRLTRALHPTLPAGAAFAVRFTLRDDHLLTWLAHPTVVTS
ncbi:4'-phosphopantetheinyl transferase [Albirhodobacter sp. R86504]|uniref:4'-phosphopantetheinyl transferase family protein n=1 Tax=Albirhodobacter sp. R86504 TaxID=3093848 RepID=UPI003670D887